MSGASRHGPVLVTGASGGIGRATALLLARRGLTVYAAMRQPATDELLRQAGCHVLRLDVTDPESATAAVGQVHAEHGTIDVLVNNAGHSQVGPVEEATDERLAAQFATNLTGAVRLTRLVLPQMRQAGRGRIVMVGSVFGRLTLPMFGLYSASKHALEGLTDALRMEVVPWGVEVALVQPAFVRTGLIRTLLEQLAHERAARPSGPYAADLARLHDNIEAIAGQFGMPCSAAGPAPPLMAAIAALAVPPERVADVIARAATAARPRARYRVAGAARMMLAARALAGDRSWDRLARAVFLR